MASVLDSIPGLAGWNAQDQINRGKEAQNMQMAVQGQGILSNMQKMQEQAAIKAAMAGAPDTKSRIDALEKIGTPMAFEVAKTIMASEGEKLKMAQGAREQAVFSPENILANTIPGQAAQPGEVMPEGIAGPPTPARSAVAPRVNVDALRQQAALTGTRGLETYSSHLANEENRRTTTEATREAALGRIQQSRDAANLLHETRLARLTTDRDREAERARHNRVMEMLSGQLASLRQPPAGVAVLGPDGKPVFVPRGQEIGRTPASSGVAADRDEQKGAMADYAETLVSRLETLLSTNPRSTTGMFSAPVRGVEAVTNAVVPGSIGSQATIAKQTKEQLISVLGQIRGGGAGRLSNQDMRRVDTAIGQLNTGTPEGMDQGLKDTRELINAMKGGAAKPATPQTETKVLNGKTYTKINGQWYEQ